MTSDFRLLVVSNFGGPHTGGLVEPRFEALAKRGLRVVAVQPVLRLKGLEAIRHSMHRRRYGGNGLLAEPLHRESMAATRPIEFELDSWRYLQMRWGAPQAAEKAAARAIVAQLDGLGFDAVQGHGLYMLPAGGVAAQVAAELKVPYFITAHGSDINHMSKRSRHHFSSIIDGAAGFFTVSERLRRRSLEIGLPAAQARVTPNGFDPTVFKVESGSAVRNEESNLRLAFVGSLESVKGADRLPEIMAHVLRHFPGAHLDIVGDGSLSGYLDSHLPGSWRIYGWRPQSFVAQIFANADILMIPSRSEGWPCVVLEAQACGTPVVGSDVGGISEAVGACGAIVADHPFSAEAFAKAVVEEASRGWCRDTVASRAANFTWDSLASTEAELLIRGMRL